MPHSFAEQEVVDLTAEDEEHNKTWGEEGRSRRYGELEISGYTVVYTDGACQYNQYKHLSRAGAGAYWGKNHPFNLSEPLDGEKQTNNRAELLAVLRAFQLEARPLEIRTDSSYVANGINKHPQKWRSNGWQKKGKLIINADLWQQLGKLLAERMPGSYCVTKVKGHVDATEVLAGKYLGIDKFGNDAADALAVAAAGRNRIGIESGIRQEATIVWAVRYHKMMVEIAQARSKAMLSEAVHAQSEASDTGTQSASSSCSAAISVDSSDSPSPPSPRRRRGSRHPQPWSDACGGRATRRRDDACPHRGHEVTYTYIFIYRGISEGAPLSL